jgi:hypothetical protein
MQLVRTSPRSARSPQASFPRASLLHVSRWVPAFIEPETWWMSQADGHTDDGEHNKCARQNGERERFHQTLPMASLSPSTMRQSRMP